MSSPSNASRCPFHAVFGKTEVGPTLAERIKTETWPLHERAEHHPFQAGLMKGRVGMPGYVALLEQTLLVHRGLESALIAARPGTPAIARLWRDHHARASLAEADLRVLGGSLSPVPLGPTASLLARINDAARHGPHALIGYFYVLEGSTNGAKFIGKALARAFGLLDGRGLSYQDPHGDQQAPRWAEFKANLADLPLSPAQQTEVIDAAKGLFAWTVQVFDELVERHGPAPMVANDQVAHHV